MSSAYEAAANRIKHLYDEYGLPDTFIAITEMTGRRNIFLKNYRPDALMKLAGFDLWTKLWNSSEDGMIHALKSDDMYRPFGSALSQEVKSLPMYYLDKTGWGSCYEKKSLSYEKALSYGEKFRNKLVACINAISKMELETVEDYKKLGDYLEKNLDGKGEHLWLHKYLHMIYPEKFSQFHTKEWKINVLCVLGVVPEKTYYGMEGQLAIINKLSGINDFYVFANVIYNRYQGLGAEKVCLASLKESSVEIVKKWIPGTEIGVDTANFENLYNNKYFQEKTPPERWNKKNHLFVVECDGTLLGVIESLEDKSKAEKTTVRNGRWNICFNDNDYLPNREKLPRDNDKVVKDPEQLIFIYSHFYHIETEQTPIRELIEKNGTAYCADYEKHNEPILNDFLSHYTGKLAKSLEQTFKKEGLVPFNEVLSVDLKCLDSIRDLECVQMPEDTNSLAYIFRMIITGEIEEDTPLSRAEIIKILAIYYPDRYIGIEDDTLIDLALDAIGRSNNKLDLNSKQYILLSWIHENIEGANENPSKANYCFIRALYDYLEIEFFSAETKPESKTDTKQKEAGIREVKSAQNSESGEKAEDSVGSDYYNKNSELIREIRVLPHSTNVFDTVDAFKDFICDILPGNDRHGRYYFPGQMMQCASNTLVLFQYQGAVRAIGVLVNKAKEDIISSDGVAHKGYYDFDVNSLLWLSIPITNEMLKQVYPEFPGFSQNKTSIPLRYCEELIKLIKQEDIIQEPPIIPIKPAQVKISEEAEFYIQQEVADMLESGEYEINGSYIPVPEARKQVAPAEKTGATGAYPRDPQKRINALKRADFTCECNPEHESFISKRTEKPYMETHHLIPLEYWESFKNSLDVEANIICLCSNCHNEIHYGKNAKQLIEPLFQKRENELSMAGIAINLEQLIEMYK